MQPKFRWTASYMGQQFYEVIDETGRYEVRARYEATDYERRITNYDDEGWQSEVVGLIGLLVREYNACMPIPQTTVDAFNCWRTAEHEALLQMFRSDPEKYGVNAVDLVKAPMTVRGARYVVGSGWIVNGDATDQAA